MVRDVIIWLNGTFGAGKTTTGGLLVERSPRLRLFDPEWVGYMLRENLEEIATALADQTDYEHRWLVDPETGEVVFWTSDTGIDGENPVELDDLELIPIDPLPPSVWYSDMADFAQGISDRAAGQRLTDSLQGRGRSDGSRASSTSVTRT